MWHLYILCAHHLTAGLPRSPCIWPPSPLHPPLAPFPSANYHSVVCVYEFVCLSVLFVHLLLFYIPHMCEIIKFLSFVICLVLLSLSTILARSIHVVANSNIASFILFFRWLRGVTILITEGDVTLFSWALQLGLSLRSSDDKVVCVKCREQRYSLRAGVGKLWPLARHLFL